MDHHDPFLTSNEEIPNVVLLATAYYKILKNHRFKMGNQLQVLTQIIIVYSNESNEKLVRTLKD